MGNINVLFCGDFAPCRKFEPVVLNKKNTVLGDALPIIQESDFSFINLECVLTDHHQAINKSGPALKASPFCIEALRDFSVVGLANNHILDYGKQGLIETIKACEKIGLPTVGAGENLAQAQLPYIREVKGIKIAIIAIAEHEFNQSENNGAGSAPIDAIDNYRQIQQAKAQADIVIVTLHGGNEYFPYPRPGLRKLCQYYIDLGVDAVICHHPHIPGAHEYYQGKPIVYSLGNFLFDNTKPPKDWELGQMALLHFSVENKTFKKMELIPYKQSVALGGVKILEGEEKEALLHRVNAYREKLEDNHAWLKEWNIFVTKQADSYIMRNFFPITFRGLGMLARNTPIAKLFYNKTSSLPKLNMLRCQSHRELLTAVLEKKSKPRND